MNFQQMECNSGNGRALACLGGTVLAVACFIGGAVASAPTGGMSAAAAGWAITGLYGGILLGCMA